MTGQDRPDGFSRRSLLAGGAALATAWVAGCSSDQGSADSPEPSRPVDGAAGEGHIVVVGAGLAGLTCALDLIEAGWDVTVLEARDRVGGRVQTVREPFSDGLLAEAGGESIDVDHEALLALIDRFGLETEDRPPNKILDGATSFRGVRRRTSDFVAQRDGEVGEDYERFYEAMEDVAADIDPEHPEAHPSAPELDAQSAAAFLDELDLSPEARLLVEADVRGGFNAEPDQLSMLFLAQQWAVGSDISDEGVEAMRIRGGNDQLPQAMADEVRDLQLGSPVERIEVHDDGVRVVHAGGSTSGAAVVVACPFMAARRIAFDPALPDDLRAAIDGLDLGAAAKVTVEYRTRFWEDDGLSGFTVADEPFGVAWSPTDSYDSDHGLLTAFLTGDAAADAADQSDEARIAAVHEQFDRVYPEGAALRTANASTIAWADEPETGGGYACYRPGQFAAFWPAIRAGADPIWFAGEHTETLAGYMESAVRSGHRIARELGDPPD